MYHYRSEFPFFRLPSCRPYLLSIPYFIIPIMIPPMSNAWLVAHCIPSLAVRPTMLSHLFVLGTSRILTRTMASLIDVDCNLLHSDLRKFFSDDDNPLALLDHDDWNGIVGCLSPSSTLQEYQDGRDVLKDYNGSISIRTTVGIHPYHVLEQPIEALDQITNDDANVVAIGECGLDTTEGFPPLADQVPFFRRQIELAEVFQLPLFVHERGAFEETMELLRDVSVPVLIHCFTGTPDQCRAYVERGYSISISGHVARSDGESVRQTLQQGCVPLDRIMIETDAPYMGFTGCRDKYLAKNSDLVASLNAKKRKRLIGSTYPNVPSSLSMVLDHVRDNWPNKDDDLATASTANALRFFRWTIAEASR